jgi:hypothetical protein
VGVDGTPSGSVTSMKSAEPTDSELELRLLRTTVSEPLEVTAVSELGVIGETGEAAAPSGSGTVSRVDAS